MQLYGMALNLRDDPAVIARYRREHAKAWPEVLARLRAVGITEMKIFLLGRRLFMYCETRDGFDPAKHGARTIGTEIPIIAEEESRAMKPDYYLVLPWHFRDEFLRRERPTIIAGTRMIFPLPKLEIVGKAELDSARGEPMSMPVVVVETSKTVELRIRAGERIDPGSVEVEIAGRTVTIHARDVAGDGRVYERRFVLHEPVIEEHAAAEYAKGWLTVVLRKRSAAPGE